MMDAQAMSAESLILGGLRRAIQETILESLAEFTRNQLCDEISEYCADNGLLTESEVEDLISEHMAAYVSADEFSALFDAELANVTLNRR